MGDWTTLNDDYDYNYDHETHAYYSELEASNMAAVRKQNTSGGSGTKTNPYWATGSASGGAWQYKYNTGYTYVNELGVRIMPTAEEIEAGFLHMSGGAWYKTESSLSGLKLIQANIKSAERRIAEETKDLEGLRAAEKLLTDNKEWAVLLDLHNRGLL